MDSKIFNLFKRNSLIFARRIRRCVVLRIGTEGTNLNLTRRDGTDGIDDDSEPRILESLILHLRVHIDTRQPATIARMRVIPTNKVISTRDLRMENRQ